MFLELAALGTALYGVQYWKNYDKIKIKKKWKEIVHFDDAVSKNAKVKPNFEILRIIEKKYGYNLIVSLPLGKPYGDLEKLKDKIIAGYGCDIMMMQSKGYNTAYIRLLMDLSADDEMRLKFKWEQVMLGAGAVNKNGETFTLSKIKEQDKYGYDCNINIPDGSSYEDLMKHKEKIDKAFGLLHCEYQSFETKSLPAKLITKPLPENFPFKPVELEKPTQLFLGYTYYYKPVIADFCKEPHLLLSGTTNSGKSLLLKMALINLAHCFSEKEVEFHFVQTSTKVGDFDDLLRLKHVKSYSYTYDYAVKMFKHMVDLIKERSEIITKKKVKNIHKYNSKVKEEDKMPMVYIVIEEFAELMSSGEKVDKYNKQKTICVDCVEKIAAQGRSCGVYLIICLQRPDRESLRPIIKANLTTRVAMQQLNDASSLVVVDSTEATKLRSREAIVRFSGKHYLIKTPWVDEDRVVRKYLKDKMDYNHEFMSFNIIQVPFTNVETTKSKGDVKWVGNNEK